MYVLKALDSFNIVTNIKYAEKGKMYYCQLCKQPVLQRRGKIRVHHFAHYSPKGSHGGYAPCSDTWTYDMTEWHMDWQNKFDFSCVERIIELDGEKHIADVLIGNIVVEFQHSPISMEDFRNRNDFYTAKGYKVIWVFDLIEEFSNQRIRLDEYITNCYHWAYVKMVFRDMHLEQEKASIYFQFSNLTDEEGGVIEKVIKASYGFKHFYTDKKHSLSVSEFIDKVKNNSDDLFSKSIPVVVPNSTQVPKKKIVGKTIHQLWQQNYTGMIVRNLSNNKVMLINGKDGYMYHKNEELEKIVGKYCSLDLKTNLFKPQGDYRVVWGDDKEVWQLIFGYIDRDYEKKQEQRKKEEVEKQERIYKQYEYFQSFPMTIEGCLSLEDLTKGNRELTMIVKNMHNKKSYILSFIDYGGSFLNHYNANEINVDTGEITPSISNHQLFALRSRKIWVKTS